MKVIDLLNKIANGEEVPGAIKWGCHDFKWFIYEYIAKGEFEDPTLLNYLSRCPSMINDEVEIIEEKEMCHKCHKYPAEYNQTWCEFCLGISKEEKKIPERIDNSYYHLGQDQQNQLFKNTINEIIDYLDYLKSKGDE